MSSKKTSSDKQKLNQKKSILASFFGRQERDETYIPELKTQWAQMETGARVKFVLGALLGLILFIGALVLVYLVLASMMG